MQAISIGPTRIVLPCPVLLYTSKMADDSDTDTILLAYIWQRRVALRKRKRQRRIWIHEITRRRKDLGEYHRLVSEMRLDSSRFKQYFRMTPTVFDELLNLIGTHIQRENTSYRKCIEPGQRLAITLRYGLYCFIYFLVWVAPPFKIRFHYNELYKGEKIGSKENDQRIANENTKHNDEFLVE